jgi:transitional endoplasmic reticulum ATPase
MSYRVAIKLPSQYVPFRLTRKASIYRPAVKYLPRRAITNIDYAGNMEAQCIVVDSPSQLYVTDNCIVTHNTYIVRAIASEANFNAISLNMENILGGIVGTSERNLKQALDLARSISPVILFVDEIDQSDMSRRGNTSGNPVASNLFSALLRFMGDPTLRGKVIVFFASNRPDLLDSALTRFGRLDETIPVRLANEEGRLGIIQTQVRLQKFSIEEDAASHLARHSEKFSAADLEAVVSHARKLAKRNRATTISMTEAILALQHIRPETPQIADYYTLLAIQACKNRELLEPEEIDLLENPTGFKKRVREARSSVPSNMTKLTQEEREERE